MIQIIFSVHQFVTCLLAHFQGTRSSCKTVILSIFKDSNPLFFSSLGSTRFLKVAKCRTWEGLVVVKVFVIHDPALQHLLSAYKKKIEDISTKLITAPNCLQFQYLKVMWERVMFQNSQICKFCDIKKGIIKPPLGNYFSLFIKKIFWEKYPF